MTVKAERELFLVVTDVVMPKMSGRELARRLAPLRPEMKVLYMSGYTDDAIVRHGVLGAGIAFLSRPFARDALAAKARELLDTPGRGATNGGGERAAGFGPRGSAMSRPTGKPIRVLVAKVGLDGHDRGAKVVARCLRDAGMEVIYTGLHRTPEEVVGAAVQEDVDVLGISILSGAHLTLFPRVLELMRAAAADDIILIGGGVIPDEDVPVLRQLGVADLILQDTSPEAIVARIRGLVAARESR